MIIVITKEMTATITIEYAKSVSYVTNMVITSLAGGTAYYIVCLNATAPAAIWPQENYTIFNRIVNFRPLFAGLFFY